MLLFWTLYSSKNPEKCTVSQFPQKYAAYVLLLYFYNFYNFYNNKKCFLNIKSSAY